MHGLIREEHHVKSGMGAKFVAQHLMTRTRHGKAVIVVTKPAMNRSITILAI